MQLEDYFEFETFETDFGPVERIRIKGRRVPIECVLESHENGASADAIVRDHYPNLTYEEVYATLTYCLRNREQIREYRRRGKEVADAYYRRYLAEEPSPLLVRLRELKRVREQAGA